MVLAGPAACSKHKPANESTAPATPPDIVLLVLDAMRAKSLPSLGCPRLTAPFLADLSSRSASFERCYSTANWTRPAVSTLLTGLPPWVHQCTSVKDALDASLPTIPKALAKLGYATGYFQSNAVAGPAFGMDLHFGHTSYKAIEKTDGDRLIAECEGWLKTEPSRPVFAYAHIFQPHGPYNPPPEFIEVMRAEAERSPPDPSYLFPIHREVDAAPLNVIVFGKLPLREVQQVLSHDPIDYLIRYEANLRYGDSFARKFFEMWGSTRGHQRAIFIVTGDHGESLGEQAVFCSHGALLTDSLLHVPLIIHDTAAPAGAVSNFTVSHLDVAATILHLAGSNEKIGGRGEILFPISESPKEGEGAALSADMVARGGPFPDPGESSYALTEGPWRLVYNDSFHRGKNRAVITLAAPRPPELSPRGELDDPPASPFPSRPLEIRSGLELLGLSLIPAVLAKGANPELRCLWRCTSLWKELPSVRLQIRHRESGKSLTLHRTLYEELFRKTDNPPKPQEVLRPNHRFEETLWPVLSDFPPGTCEIWIAGGDSEWIETGGTFEIAEDAPSALRRLIASGAGREHFALLGSQEFSSATIDPADLRTLADLFPGEGHFHYLLATVGGNSQERDQLIAECLARVPFHLRASALARKALPGLIPSRSCDLVFGGKLRLHGFEVEKSPEAAPAVLVKFYWELLAPVERALGAELKVNGFAEDWMPGVGVRPPSRWKIGEAVADILRFPLRVASGSPPPTVKFSLGIYPYWDAVMTGWSRRDYLKPAGSSQVAAADLGEFILADLPTGTIDPVKTKRDDPASYQLYNLASDPHERRNLVDSKPEIFKRLREKLLREISVSAPETIPQSSSEREITDELAQRLRALGYLR